MDSCERDVTRHFGGRGGRAWGGWTMDWRSRETRSSRPARSEEAAGSAMPEGLLPKTTPIIGSSCGWSGHYRNPSLSRKSRVRDGHCGLCAHCKHNQRRLCAAQCCGPAFRMPRSGQWRVGSRGSGKPSTAQRVGST